MAKKSQQQDTQDTPWKKISSISAKRPLRYLRSSASPSFQILLTW
jgi:hypothetical protein